MAGDRGVTGRFRSVPEPISTSILVHARDREVEVELATPLPADAVEPLSEAVSRVVLGEEAKGNHVHLAAEHPADVLDAVAEAVADRTGFGDRRDLLQMRRALPVEPDHPARGTGYALRLRPFRAGLDEDAWIRSNNRAFADHPDQGRETRATLGARMAEAWFDPDDLLLLDDPERPGELAGSCWTKRHPPTVTDPALGEIYVIGVDPSRQGRGLGPALVLGGLDHLAGRGLPTAVLYVDLDNRPARALYDRLGFTIHRRRRVYRR